MEKAGAFALIAHVSTAQGLREIRAARERGIEIWAETCPHFLTFVREDIDRLGPFLKFSPVMRDEINRREMWELLNRGFVHILGSDHCPYSQEEKAFGLENIWKAPNGIPGIEALLPVLLDGVNRRYVSLERVVEITSLNPSKLYGLYPRKGEMRPGADADLVVVDMDMEKIFTSENRKSKCPWSPYEGMTFRGWPVMTMVRGEVVADRGRILVSSGFGQYIARCKN